MEEKKYEDKKEEKFSHKKSVIKKLYEVILVSENYIVVNDNGNNRLVLGKFIGTKIKDMIEL